MAPAKRPGAFVAARFRRHGTGAFQCQIGAIFATGSQRQYPSSQPHHAGAAISLPATAGIASVAEASGVDDAQKPATEPAMREYAGRIGAGSLSSRAARRAAGRADNSRSNFALLREDLLRTGAKAQASQQTKCGDRARRAALPVAAASA